ncbi:MAG: Ni/Fe hydrogenase subunit alpha [Pirellulaceae bacterium]|nr:Ni/Fe hydrogenase subunit alpha [Pirellulaceae bacterium]
MTDSSANQRLIRVPVLTRVEGEGALVVKLDGDQVRDVQLAIYEPPRFFEAFLRDRSFEDVADITARICGICPIAYQMTAVQALEAALGVTIQPEIRNLRRLIYCGEWIESHALHIHLLHAPDFFGCASGIELARQFPEQVQRGLRMKKYGNRLLEVLGGRAIHPVNLAVGGFYRLPPRADLLGLIPDFEWGLQAACETARWVAGLPFPDFQGNYDFVALKHPAEYAIIEGRVACSDGLSVPHEEYEQHFDEQHVPHSTALQSRRIPSGREYFVGPLARVNLNRDQLSDTARRVADEIGFTTPCYNPHRSIIARAIELVHAFEEGLRWLKDYCPPPVPRAPHTPGPGGTGCAVTEAPRGLIYHRYQVTDQGRIAFAKIVPPTSQNQAQIEADLRQLLPSIVQQPEAAIALSCEQLVRTYDPCISCSTHFLKLRIERGG